MGNDYVTGYYFNRIGHVEITGPDGELHSYGGGNNNSNYPLDFKFNIRKPAGANNLTADISILGLTRDTIDFLTCWQPRNVSEKLKHEIKVYAGYENTNSNVGNYASLGEQLLFHGYIIRAIPTMPPERWLVMTADNMSWRTINAGIIELRMNDVSVEDIFNQAASKIGLKPIWSALVPKKMISYYEFSGTATTLIKHLEQLDDILVRSENGILYATDKYSQNKPNVPTLNSYTIPVSEDSGLIKINNISYNEGIEIVTRLDSRYVVNSYIEVNSKSIPSANGVYRIFDLEFVGHLRGQEWFVNIKARPNRY